MGLGGLVAVMDRRYRRVRSRVSQGQVSARATDGTAGVSS